MSLNGSATSTGDSIIMPSDISTLATIMSITRNGMKIRKPIWKADLSSLVTNEGTRMVRGTSSGLSKPLPPGLGMDQRSGNRSAMF